MYMNKKQHSMFLIDHYKMYLFFPRNLILNYSIYHYRIYQCILFQYQLSITPNPRGYVLETC